MAPRGPRDGPKRAQDVSQEVQDGSKMRSKRKINIFALGPHLGAILGLFGTILGPLGAILGPYYNTILLLLYYYTIILLYKGPAPGAEDLQARSVLQVQGTPENEFGELILPEDDAVTC